MSFLKRKRTAIAAVVAVVVALSIGGVAFGFWTSTGSGTGAAKVGAPASLTIQQVGAGYDSLVPSSNYTQDQTFAGAFITELGNDITLANPGAQELANVVVAFRNWGPAITGLPITLSINNTVGAPISVTTDANFTAATGGATPSTSDVTFDFSSQGAFVDQEFVYSITFNASGDAGGLNVALSSSANDLSVGTDTDPGTIWLSTTYPTLGNDFPTCSTPVATGTFEKVITDCGAYSLSNPGAYGTPAQVAAGSADIPAVEVNVVGGIAPAALYPGGPAQPVDFAITNPGSSSVMVQSVTASYAGTADCPQGWFAFNDPTGNHTPGTVAIGKEVAPGTTLFVPSGLTFSMLDPNTSQDTCESMSLILTFSSN
jgi:hypothetical protein